MSHSPPADGKKAKFRNGPTPSTQRPATKTDLLILGNKPGPKHARTVYMQSDDEDGGSEAEESPKKKRKLAGSRVSTDAVKKLPVNGKDQLQAQRKQLPIFASREKLIEAIRANDTTVILGETGSGKTTQLPQYLHEAGITNDGMIAITQPRRVAAMTLAARVAKEKGTEVGDLVGYSVRFDEKISPNTKIKFATDGMLVRELLLDPLLSKYSVVIVDEAHERTLRTDMILGSLKRILRERRDGKKGKDGKKMKPLKVVIMSATLEAQRFSDFFDKAPILHIKGRQYPCSTFFLPQPVDDFIVGCRKCIQSIHTSQPDGDILVFLPGQEDIEALANELKDMMSEAPAGSKPMLVLPLYAALPQDKQQRVFEPPPEGTRKVVLATNIAETSITIPGIRYVVDTGLCKERSYHTRHGGSGLEELLVKPISKSSSLQREGRAAREGPGFCYKLYTKKTFDALPEAPTPEIQRCDLNSAILDLKVLGEDPLTFDYIDRPLDDAIRASLMTLYSLQALDSRGNVTPLGRKMSAFPLEPSLALVVISSKERGCTSEILDIVSLLTCTAKLFIDNADTREAAAEARKKFQHRDGDHLTLLNVFRSYEDVLNGNANTKEAKKNKGNRRAARHWCQAHYLNHRALDEALTIRAQLRGNCEREGIDWRVSAGDDAEPVLKCLLDGFFRKAAIRAPDGTYRQIGMQQAVKIHPSSSLVDRKPSTIIFDELLITTAVYARGVSAIHSSWLVDTPLLNTSGRKYDPQPQKNGHPHARKLNSISHT